MRRPPAAWPLLVVLATAFTVACAAPATAPFVLKPSAISLDEDPIPCDSTIVTNGTCRGGYIIPY